MTETRIRPARTEEAAMLTALTVRSKAYWGYSDDFMTKFAALMQVRPETIVSDVVMVMEDYDGIIGYYSLEEPHGDSITLENLFMEPARIGKGYGRDLLRHALATAKARGYKTVLLESEPNAEGFYQKMGAVRYGERESTSTPGRFLPLMKFDLTTI
jgi:GNAT superfamily N-acetyltransferase